MPRSPVSVAHLCFFEFDWCAGGWDDDGENEDDDDQRTIVSNAPSVMVTINDREKGSTAATTAATTTDEFPTTTTTQQPQQNNQKLSSSLSSVEEFSEKFRSTQEALLKNLMPPPPTGGNHEEALPQQYATETGSSAGSLREKSDSMRHSMILTMLSSGDTALAQAAVDAARSGYPLIVSPYQVLQVRRDATTSEIQHAYRRLALWHHPGRCCGGSAISAQERLRRQHVFEILAASYETLLDREARTRCDALLRERYEERTRSKKIPQGQVCVGGKPFLSSEHNGGGGSPTRKPMSPAASMSSYGGSSAIENFAASLISQLAFIRGLGTMINDGGGDQEEEGHRRAGSPTLPPNMEPASSDSSLSPDHMLDDSSDDGNNSECSDPTTTTPSRIHMPLGTPIGSSPKGKYAESPESCRPSVSIEFATSSVPPRSSTSSPIMVQQESTTAGGRSLDNNKKSASSSHRHRHRHHPFLSTINACGIPSVGSMDSQEEVALLPALINSSSTSADVKGEVHYTEGETNRLFGGPLQLLFRARRWKPFRDPHDVFADVFGSHVPLGPKVKVVTTSGSDTLYSHSFLPNNTLLKEDDALSGGGGGGLQPPPPSSQSNRMAGWTGSSEKLPDGTQVFKTSRVLHNRRMTRTEIVRTDPTTGLKYSKVTVTSESLDEEASGKDGTKAKRKSGSPQDGCLSCTDDPWTLWDDYWGDCCSVSGYGSSDQFWFGGCCGAESDAPATSTDDRCTGTGSFFS